MSAAACSCGAAGAAAGSAAAAGAAAASAAGGGVDPSAAGGGGVSADAAGTASVPASVAAAGCPSAPASPSEGLEDEQALIASIKLQAKVILIVFFIFLPLLGPELQVSMGFIGLTPTELEEELETILSDSA